MVTAPAVVAGILALARAGGHAYAEIGRVMNVARRTVGDICKRAGLLGRPPGPVPLLTPQAKRYPGGDLLFCVFYRLPPAQEL